MTRLVFLWLLLLLCSPVLGQDEGAAESKSETDQLIANQSKLAQDYKLLEEKLFTLYEYERDLNPIRSKVLKRAYQQSQEKMTALQYNAIVQMLKDTDLKGAEARQESVLTELKSLLELLESEDRGKRVRDELRRNQEYLKEVERLLRIQRGIRGQAEGNADQKRLAKSQTKTADRADRLAKDIKRNEESEDSGEEGDDKSPNSTEGDQPSESSDSDSQGEGNAQGDGEGESGKAGKPNGEQSQEGQGDGKGQPSKSPSGQGQGGESGQGQQGQGSGEAPQDANQNPVRKRIEAAQDRMKRAQQKLEESNRNQSIEEMKAAEAELAAARKELEEILRQLREEEVERVLAMLEGRFRQMLEREVRLYETTRKLDSTPTQDRNTEFEIRAGKLSVEQNAIAIECDRALLLLREDGSSVAFPETVEQLHEDMIQVGQRLSAAKTGQITIEIEEDIIETLEYLIQALVVTQKDLEKMKQAKNKPQQGGGQPGSKPLVDSLAEIKMLRGLQDRIYRRHQRYSKLLQNPDDLIGSTNDPDLQRALIRLSDRQQQLTDIARDIVVGKNQ